MINGLCPGVMKTRAEQLTDILRALKKEHFAAFIHFAKWECPWCELEEMKEDYEFIIALERGEVVGVPL